MRTRVEQKAATRAKLLDAAALLVAARGVTAATVDAIAKEAGVTTGALYASFRNKAELLQALMTERGSDMREVPLLEASLTLGARLAEQLDANPVDARLLNELLAEAGRNEEFRAGFADRLLANVQALSDRIGAEQIHTVLPPYDTALLIEVLVAGTVSVRQVLGDALPPQLLSDAVALLQSPR